jgi:lysophospholipase L1-like esterase
MDDVTDMIGRVGSRSDRGPAQATEEFGAPMRDARAFRPRTWDLLEDRIAPSIDLGSSAITTPTERQDPGAMAAHEADVALADSGAASDVVLFGDSITGLYGQSLIQSLPAWGTGLAPFHVANFGSFGDRIENLLWRLQNGELDGQPRAAVVLIGTNNLAQAGADDIATGIAAVVQTIRQLSPQTRILVLGLLPRSTPDDPLRGEIAQVNSEIAGLDDGTDVRVLDIGGLFVRPDGSIPPELMDSAGSVLFLHPTAEGSQLISDALLAPIDALLGAAAPDPTLYGGPVLVGMPADQVMEADASGHALLAYTAPSAFDALDPHPTITIDRPNGAILALGTTIATCTATDRYGHSVSASFAVTVRPGVPPVFTGVPADQVVEATSPSGAVVAFPMPTATGRSSPVVRVVAVPPSGSTFPLGRTTVTCTATDAARYVTTATFVVDVRDIPVLQGVPRSIVVEATSALGAVVRYPPPTATDAANPQLKLVYSTPSGAQFPLGTTVVNVTARGLTGVIASDSFTITVVPPGNVATIPALVQRIFARAATPALETRSRSGRRATVLFYNPSDPRCNVRDPEAVAVLRRIDVGGDGRVSRGELRDFLATRVDGDHNGTISRYERALLQLSDPQAAQFLFPGE